MALHPCLLDEVFQRSVSDSAATCEAGQAGQHFW
jgi:hypothetical protein